jgi:hypothetical protein
MIWVYLSRFGGKNAPDSGRDARGFMGWIFIDRFLGGRSASGSINKPAE